MRRTNFSRTGMPYLHFGSGQSLVLIHGLGEIKEGWYNQYEFADDYELIIPDLRGHGENETTHEISIENFAKDVIDLLDELAISNAHICGLSMGGAVVQEIYRQKPELCNSLILANTFHYFPEQLANFFVNGRVGSFSKEKAIKLALYSWDEKRKKEFSDHFKPRTESFFDSLKACLQVNNLSLLPKIKAPTLILGSQYDSILPVWIQLWMHRLMPKSQFFVFRNAGHVSKMEAKDEFNRVVKSFLATVNS